ncbi:MAG: MgtC/SapB family protein [Elusimicrobia bacterium]|nr:MgtC/SapB family protein [Elusimicrobiota bacterium]
MENIIRVLLSVALGGIIGLEREFHDKPAGFRTNILICLGATLFTIISQAVGLAYGQDPGRISAQIVTGVGFLGAGAILRDGMRITGLTTAATIWLVAAVGMAVGYGYYELSLWSALATIGVQMIFGRLERMAFKRGRREIHLKCSANQEAVDKICAVVKDSGLKITGRKIAKQGGSFAVDISVYGSRENLESAMSKLIQIQEIADLEG